MTKYKNQHAKPEVILSAGNIRHYHYAAIALHHAGYLNRYLFSTGYTNPNNLWIGLLPEHWQNILKRRELSVDLADVARFAPLAEVISRSLRHFGFLSQEWSNWLFNELYDISMLPWVSGSDIFHFVSSIGLYGARKAKKNGKILICDLRSAYPEFEWSILKEEYEKLGLYYQPVGESYKDRVIEELSLADYYIVPSNYVADTLTVGGYDTKAIFIVPYGVTIERFGIDMIGNGRGIPRSNDDFTILSVGTIGPRKGAHYLLSAFSKLDIPRAKLILVGGVEETFQNYLHNCLSKDDRIRFVGRIPHSELHNYYQRASVFVLPSLSEGSALVIYEAMAEGVPVITTPNSGSIITNHVDGIIIPIRDDEAILSNLIWIYDHPLRSREIGFNAFRSVGNYDWKRYGDRLLDVYKCIIP